MTSKYILFGDANSPHLWKWYKELINSYDVHVVTFKKQDSFHYDNYTVLLGGRLGLSHSFGLLFNLIGFILLLFKERPKIVNAHYISSYGLVASISSLVFKFRYILSAWGSDILVFPHKSMYHKKIVKFTLNRSDVLTSDSLNMSNVISSLCKKDVITFPMGINRDDFSYNNVKSPIFTFLSLRTLIENSNVELIIRAFSEVCRTHECRLLIANDGPERNKLIRLVNELGLDDKVTFLGLVTHDRIFSLIKESHVYLSVPTSDALSVTLMEAMANEIYPICSNIPANHEILTDDSAFFVDCCESSIFSAMKSAISAPVDERLRVYKDNQDYLINNCLWENNITKLYAYLERGIK